MIPLTRFNLQFLALALAFFLTGTIADIFATETVTERRPCIAKDLVGYWEMTSWTSPLIDLEDYPQFLKHQIWKINEDGSMKHIRSFQPFQSDKKQLLDTAGIPSTYVISHAIYRLVDQGLFKVTLEGESTSESVSCAYVLGTQEKDLYEGDLVLTYRNRSGDPVLVKFLRRLT